MQQYNSNNILIGLSVLFLSVFFLIALFNFIYIGFSKQSHEAKAGKIFLATGVLTFAWILIMFLAIWFTSAVNIYAFTVFSLLLITLSNYFLVGKLLGFDEKKDKIVYSLIFAIIINPSWLTLFGVL